jgi:hypothetical protein
MQAIFSDGFGKSDGVNALDIKQKVVRMHGMQAEWIKRCCWEIVQIEGNDATRLTDDRGGQDVTVVWVR